MFAIVEHDQALAAAQPLGQRGGGVAPGAQHDAHSAGHGISDVARIGDPGQFDQPHPVALDVDPAARCGQRHPGLAHAARTNDRDQVARFAQQRIERLKLRLPANQRRVLGRKVGRRGACRPRLLGRLLRGGRFGRSKEAIALAIDAFDEARLPGIVAQRAAQFLDHRSQRGVGDDHAFPHLVEQHVLGQQPALRGNQHRQHAQRLVAECNRTVRPGQSRIGKIEHIFAESDWTIERNRAVRRTQSSLVRPVQHHLKFTRPHARKRRITRNSVHGSIGGAIPLPAIHRTVAIFSESNHNRSMICRLVGCKTLSERRRPPRPPETARDRIAAQVVWLHRRRRAVPRHEPPRGIGPSADRVRCGDGCVGPARLGATMCGAVVGAVQPAHRRFLHRPQRVTGESLSAAPRTG